MALSVVSFFTLTGAGGCGGGDDVAVPSGVERINFVLEVSEGGVRLPGNNAASFHADAIDTASGDSINVDKEVNLVHGRAQFTHTLEEALTLPQNTVDAAEMVLNFFTSITVGENGYAEGSVDTTRTTVSTDGKTATIYVSFDLASPYQEGATALLRMIDTPDTGEGRAMLAELHTSENSQNQHSPHFGGGVERRFESSGSAAI